MENWAEQIAVVCAAVRSGNEQDAARELSERCPVMPLPKSPHAERRVSSSRPTGPATKRLYTKAQATHIFARDGFCDRYSGERLVFPGVLRVLSDLFPTQFAWHPNWKIGASHNLYWLLSATIDHVVPVTYQGLDSDENWVTTSMLRNLWKSNRSLDQLGWHMMPIDAMPRWDGLVGWFAWFLDAHPEVRRRSYNRDWLRAAQRVLASGQVAV